MAKAWVVVSSRAAGAMVPITLGEYFELALTMQGVGRLVVILEGFL